VCVGGAGAGCPEAMENSGFVFSLSAWKYGKEEMGTYSEREWICVWATEGQVDFVAVYVYSCLYHQLLVGERTLKGTRALPRP